MRKLLCLMLAVIMVVSAAVIAVNAAQTAPTGAGTATVTIQSVKGDTVTKTYAVGETFTTYTYLNASQLNDGKIGSMNCSQFYTNSVLELAEEYTEDDGILDVETVFPVTKTATMASGHHTESEEYPGMGAVYYNATTPGYSGFKFNSDTAALIICRYKVKVAGEATILNEITTLAQSDYELTRIVNGGKIVNDNFTSPVALSEPAAPTGFTLSGTATSYKTTQTASDAVTLALTGSDNNYTDTAVVTASYSGIKADTAYSFANVPAGNYVLSVAKDNHVTREYTVSVSADTTQDVKICPIGDVSNDGKISNVDYARANSHFSGVSTLTGYNLQCGDVVKADGVIANVDLARINSHICEVSSLWKK